MRMCVGNEAILTRTHKHTLMQCRRKNDAVALSLPPLALAKEIVVPRDLVVRVGVRFVNNGNGMDDQGVGQSATDVALELGQARLVGTKPSKSKLRNNYEVNKNCNSSFNFQQRSNI
jgi:hypothetical protein